MTAKPTRSRRWFGRWLWRFLYSSRWVEIHRSTNRSTFELQRKIAGRIAERFGATNHRSADGSTA